MPLVIPGIWVKGSELCAFALEFRTAVSAGALRGCTGNGNLCACCNSLLPPVYERRPDGVIELVRRSLELVLDLPWNRRSEEAIEISRCVPDAR